MSSRVLHNPLSRSLLLHLTLLLLAAWYLAYAPKITPQMEPITIDVLDTSKKFSKSEEERHKQVVQKSEGQETKKAKPNSYLSDKSRTTIEETSAKKQGEIDAARTMAREHTTPSSTAQKENTKGQGVQLSDLGMKLAPNGKGNYQQERQWANSQTGETMRGGQYIKGMKEGEVSALNTKEFVFFSYFDRVRKQLDQAWQPMLREQIRKIFKTGRKLASDTDYTTRTMVTLNTRGEIVRVQVLEESGTIDLDQAAIDALNKAGPYPNPPKGLIDINGQVHIRWDFILKT